jgi:His-Xaa-Ser system protein HxsD
MLPTPLTHRMLQVDSDLVVEFNTKVQSLEALQAAAYRLIGSATCTIDQMGDRFICRLTAAKNPARQEFLDHQILKAHFLDLVTDENVRETVAAKTDGVRNVILSLAFGSLAKSQGQS